MLPACPSHSAEKPPWATPEHKQELDAAIERWRQCTLGSFDVQKTQTPDKNAALESAFAACHTEETAVTDLFLQNPWTTPRSVAELITKAKAAFKVQALSQSSAPPSPEHKIDQGELTAAMAGWRQCVSRSFEAQRTETPDGSAAAEAAFAACQTEETALTNVLLQGPWETREWVADLMTKAKAEFKARVRSTP